MLSLQSTTQPEFVERFEAHLEEMLVDHALCEKKAASTALSLMFRYPDDPEICRVMAGIVEEEIGHFKLVCDVLEARGLRYRRQASSSYASRLATRVRKGDGVDALVDRMIVCALIEARSCERFQLLAIHLRDRALAEFYGSLFESEARHYATYLRIALERADEHDVRTRLHALAAWEAEVIATGEGGGRLHA
jgi:tRNA-(ms[2]io[6]A)-hydroxylase